MQYVGLPYPYVLCKDALLLSFYIPQLGSMGLLASELAFSNWGGKVGQTFYSKNGEWDLTDTKVVTSVFNVSVTLIPSVEVIWAW